MDNMRHTVDEDHPSSFGEPQKRRRKTKGFYMFDDDYTTLKELNKKLDHWLQPQNNNNDDDNDDNNNDNNNNSQSESEESATTTMTIIITVNVRVKEVQPQQRAIELTLEFFMR